MSQEPTAPPSPPEDLAGGAQHAAAYEPEVPQQGTAEVWLEDQEPLPPRPRRRLMTPLPLALLGVLLIACGFIAGVLVEKGQGVAGAAGANATAGLAARLRGLAAGGAAGAPSVGASRGAGGSQGGAGGLTRPTAGTVSYVSGGTLYVTDAESNTIKVSTSPATSVTKTVASAVKDIHPGETVTITGQTAAGGSLSAESIRVGAAGAGGLGALFGGARAGGAGGGSVVQLERTGPVRKRLSRRPHAFSRTDQPNTGQGAPCKEPKDTRPSASRRSR